MVMDMRRFTGWVSLGRVDGEFILETIVAGLDRVDREFRYLGVQRIMG
jgi:hypothetical protein